MSRKLDLNKVKFSGRVINYEEALKDVEPFPVSENVLSGKAQMVVTSPGKRREEQVCADQAI